MYENFKWHHKILFPKAFTKVSTCTVKSAIQPKNKMMPSHLTYFCSNPNGWDLFTSRYFHIFALLLVIKYHVTHQFQKMSQFQETFCKEKMCVTSVKHKKKALKPQKGEGEGSAGQKKEGDTSSTNRSKFHNLTESVSSIFFKLMYES